MEIVAIDRFEGDIAVCEKEDMTNIYLNKNTLPAEARPGSVLNIHTDGSIEINKEEEMRRKKRIAALYKEIMNKKNG